MSPIDLGMIFPERRQIKNDSESEGKMPQKIQFNGPHKWFFFFKRKIVLLWFLPQKKSLLQKKQVFASTFFPNEWKNQKAFRPIDFVMLGTPREVLEGSWFGHQTAIATPLDIQFSVEMNN